jgi:hypothetical protein
MQKEMHLNYWCIDDTFSWPSWLPFQSFPNVTSLLLTAIDQNLLPVMSQNFKNACISNFYWGKSQKRYLVQTNQRKIKDLIARFHSWNHLFMCDAAKACSKSTKKCTTWRSYDVQKQSGRRDSQQKLTKFSLNHSSSSCLPASSPKIQDILQQNTNADDGLHANWRRTPLRHLGHNK